MNHDVKKLLVDARNFDAILPEILEALAAVDFAGLDCETNDAQRHPGLNQFMKVNDEGRKSKMKKLVFDFRRTTVTGFSVYPEGHHTAYYINLNHADVLNRVPWEKARKILLGRKAGAHWVCHNAPYELTVFRACYDFFLTEVICTLQMAVSAYGDDEYDINKWYSVGLGPMQRLYFPLLKASIGFEGREPKGDLADLVYKVIAKESDSAFSYNGFCEEISWGHGLKDGVKAFFGYEMKTFDETLNGKVHMGQLTGEETVEYGADDAYWVIPLFRRLLDHMARRCPDAMGTFFEQENPMIDLYSDISIGGMRVRSEAITDRRNSERESYASILRRFKALIRQTGGFEVEPDKRLYEREEWYHNPKKNTDGYKKYRKMIWDWANSPDQPDDFSECYLARGAVTNAWAEELGKPESKGPNLSHYMPIRTIMYDLLKAKLIVSDGKIQGDSEARGRAKIAFEKAGNKLAADIIDSIAAVAGVEQRMKLYLNPYVMLTDPETKTLYPTVTSQLVTRRMAASNPNPMQLAKRGESTYVRGFFLPDHDDHLIVSLDWSAIELVIIGELSGDPEFVKAYSQLPHEDMHAGAAADLMAVEVSGMDEEAFKGLKKFDNVAEYITTFAHKYGSSDPQHFSRLFSNLKGEAMVPNKAYSYWRTELGKGSNFGYWYSGWLADVMERMGWNMEQTAAAVDAYRQRFPDAEAWRLNCIAKGKRDGYVQLPDGHRRYRFEAKEEFLSAWEAKWMPDEDPGFRAIVQYMGRKIHKRAGNQLVNAEVQGTCSTIAKRSAVRIKQNTRLRRWSDREARFLMPIHDELLFSVRWDLVPEFITMARGTMIDHPDLFQKCKLDASPAVGVTFEPYNDKKAPFGQMEVFEAPPLDWIPKEEHFKKMSPETLAKVCRYLHENRNGLSSPVQRAA